MPGVTLGDTIADCRIEAVAGRGGMGVVYRATQLRLDRTVAVKAIVPEMAGDAAFRARFQRESRLAASIEHPNVLPVYEAGELSDGTLFLVMRWVQGTNLGELLRREDRLTPSRATTLLAPVARALDTAHLHGLVHRDVKPGNVLVSHPGEGEREHVYLTDFGIARGITVDQALTRTGVFVGSLAYAAPERIAGEPGGPASDIYSLGCVLFEVLTGRFPFARPSELAVIHAHLHDPPPSARAAVAAVPEELDEVIRVAMAKDPARRFHSAGEMAAAIDGAPRNAAGASGHSRRSDARTNWAPTATGARAEPVGRRLRLPWVVGGVAVAALAGVVIALGAGGDGGKRAGAGAPVNGPSIASIHVSPVVQLAAGQKPGAVLPLGSDSVIADPSNGRILIAHGGGRPPSSIGVGRRPVALAVDPAGRVWVVDAASGDVRVVDPHDRRTLATVRVGSAPAAIAIGGGSAWIADARDNTVRRINVSTLRLTGHPVATGGRGAAAITYDAAGTVWVANAGSSDVTAIRGGRAGAPRYVAGGPDSITATAGTWVGTASGSIVHLDQSGQEIGQPLALHSGRVMVAEDLDVLWAMTSDDATLRSIATVGPAAGRVSRQGSLAPAEAPTHLSCSAGVCLVSDATTRYVVAARL